MNKVPDTGACCDDIACDKGGCDTAEEAADLREYGQGLGVDVEDDADISWIVQEAFNAPLPASWSEHIDDEGRLYFFREASGESSWEHPMDAVYRELVDIVKEVRRGDVRSDESDRARLVHGHLRQVHQRALDALEGWSGPYSSSEGEYYYNAALKVSVWESPLAEWSHELVLRHSVLCRCLLPDRTVVGADGTVERIPPAGAPQVSGAELLLALQLPLELVRRADPDDQPRTPSTSREYFTARSGCSTTRSQLSSTRSGERKADRERGAARSSFGAAVASISPGRSDPASSNMKRSPKRAPKPPPDTITIFTRPDMEIVAD